MDVHALWASTCARNVKSCEIGKLPWAHRGGRSGVSHVSADSCRSQHDQGVCLELGAGTGGFHAVHSGKFSFTTSTLPEAHGSRIGLALRLLLLRLDNQRKHESHRSPIVSRSSPSCYNSRSSTEFCSALGGLCFLCSLRRPCCKWGRHNSLSLPSSEQRMRIPLELTARWLQPGQMDTKKLCRRHSRYQADTCRHLHTSHEVLHNTGNGLTFPAHDHWQRADIYRAHAALVSHAIHGSWLPHLSTTRTMCPALRQET